MILLRVLQVTVLLIATQFFACVFLVSRLWRPSASRLVNLICMLFVSLGINALIIMTPILMQIYTGFHMDLHIRQIPVLLWCRIGSIALTSISVWCLALHLTGKSRK